MVLRRAPTAKGPLMKDKAPPKLCGARLPMSPGRMQRAIEHGRLDQYLRRAGHRCRKPACLATIVANFTVGYRPGPAPSRVEHARGQIYGAATSRL